MKNKTFLLLLLSLPLVLEVLSGCLHMENSGSSGQVTLIIDFNGETPRDEVLSGGDERVVVNGSVWRFSNVEIEGDTVFTILLKTSQNFNFSVKYHRERYGVFVDSIGGVKGGDGRWWVYYVNDKFGEVASDRKEVKEGDEVLWIYSKNPF